MKNQCIFSHANGNNELMFTMMNGIEFPAPRQRGFDSLVWKTHLAQDEASSSTSASVAKADDTIQENIDAPKIEEPVIVQEQPSQNSDDVISTF
jgi:hypothetical protein